MKKILLIVLLIVGCGFANENTPNTSKPDILNKKKSIGIGIFTNKSPNIIRYIHNFQISEKFSFYPLIGLPYPIGLGLSWQQHYNQNGIVLDLSAGFGSLSDKVNTWYDFSLFHQWQKGNSSLFTSLGIKFHIAVRYGEEYIKCGDEDGINGCGEIISGKKEVPKTYISGIMLPLISIEKRF